MSYCDKGILRPLYRCRRCGEEYVIDHLNVENKGSAIYFVGKFLKNKFLTLRNYENQKVNIEMTFLHHCADGELGVGDIIGFGEHKTYKVFEKKFMFGKSIIKRYYGDNIIDNEDYIHVDVKVNKLPPYCKKATMEFTIMEKGELKREKCEVFIDKDNKIYLEDFKYL